MFYYVLLTLSVLITVCLMITSLFALLGKLNSKVLITVFTLALVILTTFFIYQDEDKHVITGDSELIETFDLQPFRLNGVSYPEYLLVNDDGTYDFTFIKGGVLMNSRTPGTPGFTFISPEENYHIKVYATEILSRCSKRVVGHSLHYEICIADDAYAFLYLPNAELPH